MNKLPLFLIFILFISCNEDSNEILGSEEVNEIFSNELVKRVLILESFNGSTFGSDSIIEYYENKMMLNREYYYKVYQDDPYRRVFTTYSYNSDNYLIEENYFNDKELQDHFGATEYTYNANGNIKSHITNKFRPGNYSDDLYNRSTSFEYNEDTIIKSVIDDRFTNQSLPEKYIV